MSDVDDNGVLTLAAIERALDRLVSDEFQFLTRHTSGHGPWTDQYMTDKPYTADSEVNAQWVDPEAPVLHPWEELAPSDVREARAQNFVREVIDKVPMPELHLLYKTLHDGLSIRRAACDAEVRKLKP